MLSLKHVAPSKSAVEHVLQIKGRVRPSTWNVPDAKLVDLGDDGLHHMFVACWIDGQRGACAHVQFNNKNGASDEREGTFACTLPVRDGDSNALKVQLCMRMQDEGTGNRRTAELYMSFAKLDKLLQGQEDRFVMKNQFCPNKRATVALSLSNASDFANSCGPSSSHLKLSHSHGLPFVKLRNSAVYQISRVNADMEAVSQRVKSVLSHNTAEMPPGGEPFMDGMTSRPFGGRISLDGEKQEVEPLKCHDALLGPCQEMPQRALPMALVVYHMYLKLVHTGQTAEEILALDSYNFGTFFGEAHQFTCCAGLFPYEKDFLPNMCMSLRTGVGFRAEPTEDLGWPCTDATFAGRVMRDLRPIKVRSSMSMSDLIGLFKQPSMDRASFRSLHPGLSFTPTVPVEENALPELLLHPHTDDCESSALFAQLLKLSSMRVYATFKHEASIEGKARRLQEACHGWPVFKSFTSDSWILMARMVDRGCEMLAKKELSIVTGVGLATNASAEDVRACTDGSVFCGHCFNVSRIKTDDMPEARFGILEGTGPMYMISTKESSPKVTVSVTHETAAGLLKETKTLDMPLFLTMLGATVMRLTQVINYPKGEEFGQESGWPLGVKITGWRNRTMVMSALDSDRSVNLDFYNRIMYIGLPCRAEGLGCMPVDERPARMVAGCHPFQLNDKWSRAVSAELPQTKSVKVLQEVMEETTPPMAPDSILCDLSGKWLPCRPLEAVNKEVAAAMQGARFYRTCVMESPCAPEYLAVLFEIKRRIAEETNRLNMQADGSDGIRVTPLLEGLSVILAMDVPYRDMSKLTVIDSLTQAMINLGCPTPVNSG